jgi:hypothetical protein
MSVCSRTALVARGHAAVRFNDVAVRLALLAHAWHDRHVDHLCRCATEFFSKECLDQAAHHSLRRLARGHVRQNLGVRFLRECDPACMSHIGCLMPLPCKASEGRCACRAVTGHVCATGCTVESSCRSEEGQAIAQSVAPGQHDVNIGIGCCLAASGSTSASVILQSTQGINFLVHRLPQHHGTPPVIWIWRV